MKSAMERRDSIALFDACFLQKRRINSAVIEVRIDIIAQMHMCAAPVGVKRWLQIAAPAGLDEYLLQHLLH